MRQGWSVFAQKYRERYLPKIIFWMRPLVLLLLLLLFVLASTRYVSIRPHHTDIPSNFQSQYLLAAVALLAFSGLARFKLGLIVSSILILYQAIAFHPYYFGGSRSTESPNLRVVVANVYGANLHFLEFSEWIKKAQPDVLLLQETEGKWPTHLKEYETEYPYARSVSHSQWGFSATIMSRIPIEDYKVISLPRLDIPVQRVVISVGSNKLALYNLHLFPTSPQRFRQNEALRNELSQEPYPCVVAGDFNSTIWSAGHRDLLRDQTLRNAAFGFGYQPTWPARVMPLLYYFLRGFGGSLRMSTTEKVAPALARVFGIPLDHCYVSPDLGVVLTERGPGINSDHLPILVDIAVPQSSSAP